MSDDNKVTHEDAVDAVRKALVDAATREYEPGRSGDKTLKLAQAYEHTMRAEQTW